MAVACVAKPQCCAAVYVAMMPASTGSPASPQLLWASQTPMTHGSCAWLEHSGHDRAPGGRLNGVVPACAAGPLAAAPVDERALAQLRVNGGAWHSPLQATTSAAGSAMNEVHGHSGWMPFGEQRVPVSLQPGATGSMQSGTTALAPDPIYTEAASGLEVVGTVGPSQLELVGTVGPSHPHARSGRESSPTSRVSSSTCGNTATCTTMSSSMLRRRRRQRAAQRLEAAVSEVPPEEVAEDTRHTIDPSASPDDDSVRLANALLQQLRCSSDPRQCAARFRRLAFADKTSSRAAQLALEETEGPAAAVLVMGMHGHVRTAMRSMYANYVIQKIVEMMPWASASFISRELLGAGQEMAKHRFGCRIICRLLEHGPLGDHDLAALLDEVLVDASALSCHAFGNYVVRHILEFGLPEHRHRLVSSLPADLSAVARDQHGSRVVEAALQFSAPDDMHMLSSELLRDPNRLTTLAMNLSGRHVVKALLHGNYQRQTAAILRPAAGDLRESKYGKLVLEILEGIPA
eukprot:TRINITY_DN9605_c0_g1_i1.p1 TRINITY_DN9605_c0_g1~~TRINITY_DN9605_c0_g1_i1.p1  ORF type:complete len:519 (-),score=74.24 TRINITY_DN9605_c0_g1_i1:102-1658(-)